MGVLLAHRLEQDAERAAWGEAYAGGGLVFAREDGTRLHPELATKTFARLARQAGVRPVRLHDLRHGQASLMLAAGVDMAVVSKRLGHSSITLTSDLFRTCWRVSGGPPRTPVRAWCRGPSDPMRPSCAHQRPVTMRRARPLGQTRRSGMVRRQGLEPRTR